MAYCYIYFTKDTHKVAYVGKVNQGNSLEQRIKQHQSDWWYKRNKFEIFYTELDSSASADIAETALIGEFAPPYNKEKMSWGKTNLISYNDFEWKKFRTQKEIILEKRERILRELQDEYLKKVNSKVYTLNEILEYYRNNNDEEVCFCGLDKDGLNSFEISLDDGDVMCRKNRGVPEERSSYIYRNGRKSPDIELFVPKRVVFTKREVR